MVKSGTTKQEPQPRSDRLFQNRSCNNPPLSQGEGKIRFADMFTESVFLPELILRTFCRPPRVIVPDGALVSQCPVPDGLYHIASSLSYANAMPHSNPCTVAGCETTFGPC
jgi:hypothetical protein